MRAFYGFVTLVAGIGFILLLAGCQPEKPTPDIMQQDTQREVTLLVPGCKCVSSAMEIRSTLEALDGVNQAETDIEDHLVVVSYDPSRNKLENMIQALQDKGFPIVRVVTPE